MPEVRERDKELRFTRSGQAVGFWIAAAVCAIAAMVLFAVSVHRQDNPVLPHPAWSLPPVLFAYVLARLAVRLTRHAYEVGADGALIVRFRAGGALEMLWHLQTWGDAVEVLEPPDLVERATASRNVIVNAGAQQTGR